MRKDYTVMQSLLLRSPNHQSRYDQNHEKHSSFHICLQRIKIVRDVTNVEQHYLESMQAVIFPE